MKSVSWSDPKYHESIGMMYSRHKDGRVMTEDRVIYTKSEVQIIADTIGIIDKQVHMIKDLFEGEIVRDRVNEWERR